MNFYNVRTITWMGSWASRDRMWGTFVWLSINSTAAFYATYTFVLLGIWFFIKNRKSKLFLLILIIMNFYCVLFLFSRGAYAAALLGFLILGLLYKKWFLIPVVLTVLLWQTVLPKQVIERIQVTVQEDGSLDTSAERRVSLWQEGMNYFLENPIFGMGYNTFSYRAKGADTHNLFVRTLAEEGVIGFLFLLAIFFTAFLKATLLYKRTNDKFLKGLGLGFAVCSMAMLAANFFGDRWSFLQVGSYFWLFLAMVERGNAMTALELISRKKRKR
jgi:O-antigen ligase